jgi:membrane protease YdiL (CAAX protease family)
MRSDTPVSPPRASRPWQAIFVTCYFCLYLGYLFLHPEGELLHWLSLVLLPLVGLAVIGRYASPRTLVQSIGLAPARPTRGLAWVVTLGAGFQVLQLLNTRQRVEFLALLHEPVGFLLPVGALVLLLGTVATTEEIFFRGILQSRFADQLRSEPAALLLAGVAFVAYHVPFAYLNPAWPSAGDISGAVQLAAVNGSLTGLALGVVYWRSGRNLFAAILLHALIDLVPATRLVHGLLTGGR